MARLSSSSLTTTLLIFLLFTISSTTAENKTTPSPDLSLDYYNKTCPQFNTIMTQVITTKQLESPTTAAAVLRLFFHDCMIGGCDASALISSNAFNIAERDADPNLSLPGDGFDLVTRAKTALELVCPGTVSCSDILAISARDLVRMVGGPFYQIRLGRRDGLISRASRVAGNIAFPNMTMTTIITMFGAKNFSVQEMVTLVGAHTIGFSHCKQFSNRLYNYSKDSTMDPRMNPEYAKGLQNLCKNYKKDPSMAAFNDVMTPGKFDNMYYKNLGKGLGLLATDQAMVDDPRTKPFVEMYANDEKKFFEDFSKAMEKVSEFEIKTSSDKDSEIRTRCDQFNNINVNKVSS